MPDLLEAFSQEEVLTYAENRVYPDLIGEALMPAEKTASLELRVIKGSKKVPVAARVHGFDTESQIINREGESSAFKLSLFKQKIQLREEEIIRLNSPRNPAEERAVMRDIYNDIDKTRNGVRAGIEVVRMETLTKGRYFLNLENGQQLEVDYGVPAEQQRILSGTDLWSNPDADILGLLSEMVDLVGQPLTRAMTSPEILNMILKNNAIRDTMYRTSNFNVTPSRADLNSFLGERDLPQIGVNRQMYDDQDPKTRANTRKRYFDRNYFVMLPEGEIGATMFGTTAEEIRLTSRTDITTEQVGNILSMVYEETVDPVSSWTKSVALAMPSFLAADDVVQIKAAAL